MKKKKSKSKTVSENTKLKKELTEKLVESFTAIINDYGKVKKSKAVIDKFVKQLSKKIDFGKAKPTVPVGVAEKPVVEEKSKAAKKAPTETTK